MAQPTDDRLEVHVEVVNAEEVLQAPVFPAAAQAALESETGRSLPRAQSAASPRGALARPSAVRPGTILGFVRRATRLAALAAALASPAAIAADHLGAATGSTTTGGRAGVPGEVVVGMYLNQITAINLKDNSFNADFYIWFRWRGPEDYKPLETFEVMNGRVESKGGTVEKKIGEVHYASARVLATINKQWDLRSFPLDSHTLSIQIEDSRFEQSELRFAADDANTGRNPSIELAGWVIKSNRHRVAPHVYRTNYGDTSVATGNESRYSRFTYSVEIARPGWTYPLKHFSTVIISTFVAFLAFLIRPTNVDPRFGLGIGALFAVVASEFVVASSLPESDSFNIADLIHLTSIAVIFLTLLASAASLRRFESGREAASQSLDRACLACFPIVYALACLALVPARTLVG